MSDLERRAGQQKQESKAAAKAAKLFQRPRPAPAETGEDCARAAHNPDRRFDPLRRQGRPH